jgi:large subunit ribosomal protein L21
MTYAIIAVGGKQYRVREGEWLLVDRVPVGEGKTFTPDVLLVGGDANGDARFGDELKDEQVTALVAAHVLGEKVVVGKHRQRTGYRRRKGHRSRLSRIEIQSIGAKTARRAATKKSEPAEAKPKATASSKPGAAKAKPEAGAKKATKAKEKGD